MRERGGGGALHLCEYILGKSLMCERKREVKLKASSVLKTGTLTSVDTILEPMTYFHPRANSLGDEQLFPKGFHQ